MASRGARLIVRLGAGVALLLVPACAAPAATAPPSATAPDAAPATAPAGPNVIPFRTASVTEDPPGVFTLAWDAPGGGGVSVYSGADRDRIARDTTVATGDSAGTRKVTGLAPVDRRWFELVPEHGRPLTLADRSLHLASAPNFRDLGGYRTRDGRWVRMGVLYRSDQLDKLSDADAAELGRLGLRTVVDLRTDPERQAGADKLPAGARPVVADVLTGTGAPTDLKALLTSPADPAATMRDLERLMVDAPPAQAAYRSLLTEIARPDRLPLVFHCTAGKDRTGWAAATVLGTVGVPADAVLADYLESNRYAVPKYAPMLATLPAEQATRARALVEVRPEYLQAGLDAAGRYGSVDGYVARALGVPPQGLRDRLLEP